MQRDEIVALIARRETAWLTRDAAALTATHGDKGTVVSPFGGVQEGRAEIERIYRLWFSAFPDIVFHQDDLLIDGDRAVLIGRMSATHAGDFFGLAPTGRHFEAQIAFVLKFAAGAVQEERRIYDFTGLLVQVGVLKAKPSA
jgi:predicted ester cyclase